MPSGLIEDYQPTPNGLSFASKHLGKRLVEHREAAGLKPAEAAEIAAVSQAAYARLEGGVEPAPQAALEALALRYDCKASDLRPNETMPSAPAPAVERLAWVRERNAAIRAGFKRNPSGTEGKQAGK
jgi:transcriptional regulator with XRE-family HTH domain